MLKEAFTFVDNACLWCLFLYDRIACSSFAFALLLPSIDLANNGMRMTQVLDNLRRLCRGSIPLKDFELLSTRRRIDEFVLMTSFCVVLVLWMVMFSNL